MQPDHGGDRIASVLVAHGVRFVFTLCGGHISPILVGCKRQGIRVVDVRHEATAVFAADAVARLSGVPGVAAVTAGPGLTNAVTAIKNAQLAQSPVVVFGGATATMLRGRGALQDIDQRALLAPHVKAVLRVGRVRELGSATAHAFAIAAAGVPGPVLVETPVDLLYPERVVRDWYGADTPRSTTLAGRWLRWYLRRHLDRLFDGADRAELPAAVPVHAPSPPERAIERAARRLVRAERPLVLVGSQALAQPGEAEHLASAIARIGAPVYLSGMARGLLGPDHPLQLRHERKRALAEADLVVLAGVPADFRLNYGRHLPRRGLVIAANRSRHDLRLNRRPDIAARGDAGLFLRRLAGSCGDADGRWSEWIARLRERDAAREAGIGEQAELPTDGLNPLRLCREIDAVLEPSSVLVADGGDFVATASYTIRPRGPLAWLDPGPFGTLGVGAGFALAAKLCRPASDVWLLYGDGSLGYTLAEFDTFVRHAVPIVAVVGNDACWMQIARDQIGLLGDDVGCPLLPTDYDRAAAGLGAVGLALDASGRPAEVLRVAREAARGGRPVLVNARIGRSEFRKGSISI